MGHVYISLPLQGISLLPCPLCKNTFIRAPVFQGTTVALLKMKKIALFVLCFVCAASPARAEDAAEEVVEVKLHATLAETALTKT